MMWPAPLLPLSSLALKLAELPSTLNTTVEAPFRFTLKLGIADSCAAVRSNTAMPLAPAIALITSLLPVVGRPPVAASCDSDVDSASSCASKSAMPSPGAPI